MADSQVYVDTVVCNLHLIVVGRHPLVVPSDRDDVAGRLALRDTQAERAALTMVGDDDGQAVEHLGGIVAARRIDAHQAVRQLDGREAGHEQMADASDVRVDVIDWLRL